MGILTEAIPTIVVCMLIALGILRVCDAIVDWLSPKESSCPKCGLPCVRCLTHVSYQRAREQKDG